MGKVSAYRETIKSLEKEKEALQEAMKEVEEMSEHLKKVLNHKIDLYVYEKYGIEKFSKLKKIFDMLTKEHCYMFAFEKEGYMGVTFEDISKFIKLGILNVGVIWYETPEKKEYLLKESAEDLLDINKVCYQNPITKSGNLSFKEMQEGLTSVCVITDNYRHICEELEREIR